MESLSLQAHEGLYNYRPQRKIDATQYKWQFEDIKPLTTPLQFCFDNHPFPFYPREMELHLHVKFKVSRPRPSTYHNDTSKFIVGPMVLLAHPVCIVVCKRGKQIIPRPPGVLRWSEPFELNTRPILRKLPLANS